MAVPGDIVLVAVPDPRGSGTRLRPTLVLAQLPGPFQRTLVCGFSTERLDTLTPEWDTLVDPTDPAFPATGLKQTSALRLSFLYAARESELGGVIGVMPAAEFESVRVRLARLFA